jgi:hypothetical protein
MGKACGTPCSSICHNRNFRKQVCQYRLPVRLTMTLKVATVVQQIMTELSETVAEEDKIMVITKMVLNLKQQMAARVHRQLNVIVFNANGIWRQIYELND